MAQQPCAGDRVTSSSPGTHVTCTAASFPGVTIPMRLTARCRQPEHGSHTWGLGSGYSTAPGEGEPPMSSWLGPTISCQPLHTRAQRLWGHGARCAQITGSRKGPGRRSPRPGPSNLPELTLTPGMLQKSGGSW